MNLREEHEELITSYKSYGVDEKFEITSIMCCISDIEQYIRYRMQYSYDEMGRWMFEEIEKYKNKLLKTKEV